MPPEQDTERGIWEHRIVFGSLAIDKDATDTSTLHSLSLFLLAQSMSQLIVTLGDEKRPAGEALRKTGIIFNHVKHISTPKPRNPTPRNVTEEK